MPFTDKERLVYILDRLELSPGSLADKLQISVNRIKSIKYGKGRISADLALLIEQVFGFDFKWIMTGQGSPYSPQNSDDLNKTDNVFEFQHMKLIRRFNNKQLALNITYDLIELEKLDPESFKRIESYLKGTVDTIRDVGKRASPLRSGRRQTDRRAGERSNKVPKHLDRRNKKDRRKPNA